MFFSNYTGELVMLPTLELANEAKKDAKHKI